MRSKRKKKLLCYLSVLYIYTDRREIKLCKKFIYSYSTRLAFHMPGFYLLTILNYFIVVPASGELPCTYSGKLKLKHQTVTLRVKFTGNIWFPDVGLHSLVKPGGGLGWLSYLLSLSGLVCLLLFIFVLVLAFCSVEYALQLRFVASLLAVVFVSLNCVCLYTLV